MSFLACAVALLHLLSTAPIVPVDARPEKFPDDLWCSVCKLTMKHAAKEVWDERRSKKAVRKVLEDDFCEKMLEGLENVPPPIGIGCENIMSEHLDDAVQGLMEQPGVMVSDKSALAMKACMADIKACDDPKPNEFDKIFAKEAFAKKPAHGEL